MVSQPGSVANTAEIISTHDDAGISTSGNDGTLSRKKINELTAFVDPTTVERSDVRRSDGTYDTATATQIDQASPTQTSTQDRDTSNNNADADNTSTHSNDNDLKSNS